MGRWAIEPTGRERMFERDEMIVSKTDTTGRITYANEPFLRLTGYAEDELLGAAHSLVRHPDMPRGVFRHIWSTIEAGHEVFAFVKNLAKCGDHYWVLAHVTPTFDATRAIVGYHSSRRCPDRSALARIEPLYAAMLEAERSCDPDADSAARGLAVLDAEIAGLGMRYDEFIFSLLAKEAA